MTFSQLVQIVFWYLLLAAPIVVVLVRSTVVRAVWWRNLSSYFSSLLGYLFIVLFVFAASLFAFDAEFFAANLATLDRLTERFPLLLLFIVPAIAMSAWADEKKQGTDELLFTLPASDLQIVLGKYFAVLTVYAIAIAFSLTHLAILAWYSDPDWGMLLATYFGYLVAGAALLSVGMFGSSLASSPTVAFVVGALLCAVPVFVADLLPTEESLPWLSWVLPSRRTLAELSLSEQLHAFGLGLIPVTNLLYFLSLTVLMGYLNLVVITQRHWKGADYGTRMEMHFAVRALALAVTLVCFNSVVSLASGVINLQADLTAEKVFTLSPITQKLIGGLKKDNPITIQAFYSREVPRELLPHKKRLLGLLRQYDRLGGQLITVRYVEVEPASEQAEEAELLGITPQRLTTTEDGRHVEMEVYLGALVTSATDDVLIPYFQPGVPVEYELTRSIRTVSQESRRTVGILRTDARVNGGFSMSTFRSLPEWQIKRELAKQYKVEEVSPDVEIPTDKYDVLIAVMPSSLTQPQMENFVNYVKTGKPVLIFDDPLTYFDAGQTSPRQPKPRPGGMFGGAPPEQKADGGRATTLLNALQIAWDNGEVVWDNLGRELHPRFAELVPPEFVFISARSGMRGSFNENHPVTRGLQEVLLLYPGRIRPRADSKLAFEPLMRTTVQSGVLSWDEVTEPGLPFFGGINIRRNPRRVLDADAHVVAAEIRSKPSSDKGNTKSESEKDEKQESSEAKIHVIYVADADIISDQLFAISQTEAYDLRLDNVRFVLNAVDYLAGDTAYIELRSRRPTLRTLTEIQNQTRRFAEERQREIEKARKEADEALEKARERLEKIVEEIRKDQSLSPIEKEQKIQLAQQIEQRRLDVAEANIERERKKKEKIIRDREQRLIRALQQRIRMRATILPLFPPIVLAIVVLGMRRMREEQHIEASRRVGEPRVAPAAKV
ncbi:MAG: ABC transporter permease [Planctomycetota bacterium]|nr:MAG: ABC transporter permease [Planctomycetota bacterium]